MEALLRHSECEIRCYGAFTNAAFGTADGDDFLDIRDWFLLRQTWGKSTIYLMLGHRRKRRSRSVL